ncbi:MAG TPA: 5-formyltetrahydrofolate cyclo-ligase [Haloplasmataceae bacterium]
MKEVLRKQALELRNALTKEEVLSRSRKIITQIKSQIDLSNYQVLGFYMPLGNEVDLRPLMKELLEMGKTIVIPKVLDKETMEFFPIKDLFDYHIGTFKVLEPNSNKIMPKTKIEIIFVPGLYFSYQKYRLGFGGGFYDRYLKDYSNKKIGVAYSFQYIKEIPYNEYDIPLDIIITENPLHQFHDED